MDKPKSDKTKTYIYKRYMRDGTTKEITAVIRSRKPSKK